MSGMVRDESVSFSDRRWAFIQDNKAQVGRPDGRGKGEDVVMRTGKWETARREGAWLVGLYLFSFECNCFRSSHCLRAWYTGLLLVSSIARGYRTATIHLRFPATQRSDMISTLKKRNRSLSLTGRLVRTREPLDVVLDIALVPEELDVGAVDLDLALLLELDVLIAAQRGEAPVLADDDLLAAGELVHAAAEGLDGGGAVGVTRADGEQNLADVDAGDGAVGLAPGAAHAGLQTIGACAG